MNKLLFSLIVCALVLFTGCSDDDDADGIVGTWEMETEITFGDITNKTVTAWKFSADNTGNYNQVVNSEEKEASTFSWTKDGEWYLVDYQNADMTGIKVKITSLAGYKMLEDKDEITIAMKK